MKLAISATWGERVQSWPLDVLPVRIGRDSTCQIQIRHKSISRQHAEILRRGGLFLRDLSSKNGTRLNGVPVREMARLLPGDRIELGSIPLALIELQEEHGSAFGIPCDDKTTVVDLSSVDRHTTPRWDPPTRILIHEIELVGRSLTRRRTFPKLCDSLLRSIETALPTSRVLLLARAEPGSQPKAIASRCRSEGPQEPPLLSETALRDLLDNGRTAMETRPGRAAMAAPLLHDGEALGLLYVESEDLERGFTREHLELLTLFANMAAIRLAGEEMHAVVQKHAQIDRDLAAAGKLQSSLLPSRDVCLEGYQLAIKLEPCHAVGGDFIDVRRTADGAAWLLLGDVSGKGVPAAILMSQLLSSARVLYENCGGPDALVARLSAILSECADVGHFATAFAARLDLPSGTLQYVNAGHPAPMIVLGSELRTLDSNGFPLGVNSSYGYRSHTTQMAPGSTLAAFSDGLPETRSGRAFFGQRRAESAIRATSRCDRFENAPDCLFAALGRFRGSEPRSDDVAVLLLRRNAAARKQDRRRMPEAYCRSCSLRMAS